MRVISGNAFAYITSHLLLGLTSIMIAPLLLSCGVIENWFQDSQIHTHTNDGMPRLINTLSSRAELPECISDYEDLFFHLIEENETVICSNSEWIVMEETTEPDPEDNSHSYSCSGPLGDYTITIDQNKADLDAFNLDITVANATEPNDLIEIALANENTPAYEMLVCQASNIPNTTAYAGTLTQEDFDSYTHIVIAPYENHPFLMGPQSNEAVVCELIFPETAESPKQAPASYVCGGPLGDYTITIGSSDNVEGAFDLDIFIDSVSKPGDIIQIGLVDGDSMSYLLLVNQGLNESGTTIYSGTISQEDINSYTHIRITPYEALPFLWGTRIEEWVTCSLRPSTTP